MCNNCEMKIEEDKAIREINLYAEGAPAYEIIEYPYFMYTTTRGRVTITRTDALAISGGFFLRDRSDITTRGLRYVQ